MERTEIINSQNFRSICANYGLNWADFEIYGDTIVLFNDDKKLMFIFDENYNIVNIHEPRIFTKFSVMVTATHYYNIYSSIDETIGTALPYPFQKLSIKDIMDIADRIEILDSNNGHTTSPIVNGKAISNEDPDEVKGMLIYTKFLGEEIKKYYEKLYEAKMLGVQYPNIYTYINKVISVLNDTVNKEIKSGNLRGFINNVESLNSLGRLKTPEALDNKLMMLSTRLIHTDKIAKLERTDSIKSDPDYLPNISQKFLDIPKYPKELISMDFDTTYSINSTNSNLIKIKSSKKKKD